MLPGCKLWCLECFNQKGFWQGWQMGRQEFMDDFRRGEGVWCEHVIKGMVRTKILGRRQICSVNWGKPLGTRHWIGVFWCCKLVWLGHANGMWMCDFGEKKSLLSMQMQMVPAALTTPLTLSHQTIDLSQSQCRSSIVCISPFQAAIRCFDNL